MRVDERAARLRQQIRDQDGVFSNRQATEAGYSDHAVRARVARGEWVREGHGVLRAADHPRTPRSRIRAVMLSLGADATVVGRSALFWWHLSDTAPAVVEVAVPPGSRVRARPGAHIVRRTVLPEDRMVVDGVACTKKAATVLAAVAVLGLLAGAAVLDRVLQRSVVTLDELRRVHTRSAGRRGTEIARRLLALAGGGARSEAERTAHSRLRAAGIVGWQADVSWLLPAYGPALLDLAFLEHRVLVEIDGWAYHRDLRAFLRDARRQNALMLQGWVVIRTNWFELTERPDDFVANVRTALARPARVPT